MGGLCYSIQVSFLDLWFFCFFNLLSFSRHLCILLFFRVTALGLFSLVSVCRRQYHLSRRSITHLVKHSRQRLQKGWSQSIYHWRLGCSCWTSDSIDSSIHSSFEAPSLPSFPLLFLIARGSFSRSSGLFCKSQLYFFKVPLSVICVISSEYCTYLLSFSTFSRYLLWLFLALLGFSRVSSFCFSIFNPWTMISWQTILGTCRATFIAPWSWGIYTIPHILHVPAGIFPVCYWRLLGVVGTTLAFSCWLSSVASTTTLNPIVLVDSSHFPPSVSHCPYGIAKTMPCLYEHLLAIPLVSWFIVISGWLFIFIFGVVGGWHWIRLRRVWGRGPCWGSINCA